MVSSSLLKKKIGKSDEGLGLTFADQTKVVEGVFLGKNWLKEKNNNTSICAEEITTNSCISNSIGGTALSENIYFFPIHLFLNSLIHFLVKSIITKARNLFFCPEVLSNQSFHGRSLTLYQSIVYERDDNCPMSYVAPFRISVSISESCWLLYGVFSCDKN